MRYRVDAEVSRSSFGMADWLGVRPVAVGNTSPAPSARLARFVEHGQGPVRERHPVFPLRLHALGGDRPDGVAEVDLFPAGTADLRRATCGQDQNSRTRMRPG